MDKVQDGGDALQALTPRHPLLLVGLNDRIEAKRYSERKIPVKSNGCIETRKAPLACCLRHQSSCCQRAIPGTPHHGVAMPDAAVQRATG